MSDTDLTLDPVPQAARATGNGFKCTACGFADTVVKDTRPTNFGPYRVIRRRRLCTRCRGRNTTVEISLEALELLSGGNLGEMLAAMRAVESAVQRLGSALRRKPSS